MADSSEPQDVEVSADQVGNVRRYMEAKAAQAAWDKETRRLKAEILDALGFDDEDPKPQPVNVHHDGTAVCAVTVGTYRGLNFKYLKENFPEVYAICETTKPTLKITE